MLCLYKLGVEAHQLACSFAFFIVGLCDGENANVQAKALALINFYIEFFF